MAKYINGKVRITAQDGDLTKTFETEGIALHSTDSGMTYELTIGRVKLVDAYVGQMDTPSTSTPAPSVPAEAEKAKEAMLQAARDYEKATLDSARQLQKAQEAVNSVQSAAAHRFNQALLSFYHEGNNPADADKVLNDVLLYGHEGRTLNVMTAATEELYGVDPEAVGM